MKRELLSALFTGAIFGSVPSPLLADKLDRSLTDLTQLSLEELVTIPVSIATNSEQKIASAPSNVSVYRYQDFVTMGVRTLDELLNYIPGFQTQREDQYITTYIARGRRSGPDTNGVLVLIDGVRINDPLNGGAAGTHGLYNLDTIERVEVIRGPGSALYGSNAMLGVVNLITQKNKNNLSASFGYFGTKELTFNNHFNVGRLGISSNFHAYDDQGKTYKPFFSVFGIENDIGDPLSRISSNLTITLDEFTLQLGHFYRRTEDFTAGGSLGPGNDTQRTNTYHTSTRLSWDKRFNDHELRLYAEGTWVKHDFTTRIYPGAAADIVLPLQDPALPLFWTNGSTIDVIGGNRRTGNTWTIGAVAKFKLSDKTSIQTAATYIDEHSSKNPFQGNWDVETHLASEGLEYIPDGDPRAVNVGFYTTGGFEIVFIDPQDRNSTSGSLQIEHNFSDEFNVTVGARYDTYNDVGDNLSLRAAAIYQPTDNTSIKIIYGEAFRPPTLAENYANFSSIAVGNPDARPESIHTFETTVIQKLGNIQLSATWFHNSFIDPILPELVEDILTGFSAFKFVNSKDFSSNGWEFEALAAFNNGWSFRAGYSLFNLSEKIGVAENLAFASVNYASGNLNANINGHYRGRVLSRVADGTTMLADVYLPSLIKVNARIAYYLSDDIEVSFEANNLFDNDFREYSPQQVHTHGIPTRGLSLLAGMRWQFQ